MHGEDTCQANPCGCFSGGAGEACLRLSWLTEAHKEMIEKKMERKGLGSDPKIGKLFRPGSTALGVGEVKPGREGIDGLAEALGGKA